MCREKIDQINDIKRLLNERKRGELVENEGTDLGGTDLGKS